MSITTSEEIWALFRENAAQMKETRQMFQETDRGLQKLKEILEQQSEKFAQRMEAQEKAFNKQLGVLTDRLGDFVEAFVEPSVVRLFQERGLDVTVVTRDVKARNPKIGLAMEIDLFVINGDSCVLIEVKSNLSIDDINEHIERMSKFKPLFPLYVDKKVYGAVTGMVIPDNVAKYAYKKGFFVIAQQGDSAIILNDQKFQPTAW